MRLTLRGRRRVGVSELVGVVLTVGITIIAGAAVWGYVRIQANISENSLNNGVLVDNDFLSEHFNVETMYFGSTTSATFWVYNTGNVPFLTFSVRLYGPSGTFNLLYNYTVSGSTKTDQVYDLKSGLASLCKTAASSYESPLLSTTAVKLTTAQTFTLTIPSTQSNCPSFGSTFASGSTYTVVVTGLYGNVVTYSTTM